MKRTVLLIILLVGLLGAYKHFINECDNNLMPLPTESTQVKADMEEEGKGEARRAWFELLHQSDENLNWRHVEERNMFDMAKKRKARRKALLRSGDEEIANGLVSGQWDERGSSNQAGSVLITEYDQMTDEVYTVSAGGTLWKGLRIGIGWEVVNQDLRFGGQQLHIIHSSSGKRIIAEIGDISYYSDDEGLNWIKSQGFESNNSNANLSFSAITADGDIICLHKAGYWEDLKIYFSEDKGENYRVIKNFFTSDMRNIGMHMVKQSGDLIAIEQLNTDRSRIHMWDSTVNEMVAVVNSSPIGFGSDGRANITGAIVNDTMRLYSYLENREFHMSVDTGKTWTQISTLPVYPWNVGVYILPSDPSQMVLGAVNSYRSSNGGKSWTLINEWYEYYSNINAKLHADIMFFREFEPLSGEPFLLISNHGGLSESLDGGINNRNIGLYGLNVAQYYDVRTYPADPKWVFAGAQDQGFQRGPFNSSGPQNFTQVISGDYGHIEFTNNGEHLWTVYPGGWVSYYPNPTSAGYQLDWELESEQESVWIPPLMSHPDPTQDIIYMAGGNVNGGQGSHIIKLEPGLDELIASQSPFNFGDFGGEISAMAVSPFDSDIWYIAMTNGVIAKSTDGGNQFEFKTNNAPSSHYLYGSCILPSKNDPNIIYISGSGYSTAPVIVSTDGGESFQPMSNGMPSTTAFAIAANEDESLLFAATESGPYVYVRSEETWYDMYGVSAPNTTYWSVEYLEASQTVRFGTYGRGIWDFNLSPLSSTNETIQNSKSFDVYPNPTSEIINIQLPETKNLEAKISIFDLSGRNLSNQNTVITEGKTSLNVDQLEKGTYAVLIRTINRNYHSLFIKI